MLGHVFISGQHKSIFIVYYFVKVNICDAMCAIWYQTLKSGTPMVGQNAVLTS